MSNRAPKAKPKIVQVSLAQSGATLELAPEGYSDWIRELKVRVHEARHRAARAVNSELVGLDWRIGRDIRARQGAHCWGAKMVDRIAADLKTEFPDTEGFSPRNLKYMRAFAVAWPDEDFVQGVLAQLPWYTHVALLDKLDTLEERRWCAEKAAVPLGIADYELVEALPNELDAGLPSIARIEEELRRASGPKAPRRAKKTSSKKGRR